VHQRPDEIPADGVGLGCTLSDWGSWDADNDVFDIQRKEQRDDEQGERLIGKVVHAPRPDSRGTLKAGKRVEREGTA
jgi:hypothetical protein